MTNFHRIVLAGLLLTTQACRSQDASFAPRAAEVSPEEGSPGQDHAVEDHAADEHSPDLASDVEPAVSSPERDSAPDEPVASVPVAAPAEVLAVRNVVRTAEHDRLEDLAGRFEVLGSFHPRPDSNPRPVEGTLVTTWRDDTVTLEGVFEGTLWAAPFSYVSETSFDPTLGCWIETWWTMDGAPVRGLAQGYDHGDGCVVTVRHEDGRLVRDEIQLSHDAVVRRIWRTTAEGVEYLSLELNARRVD